jgi:uncharacterized protein with HEPN domain
MRDDTAYLLDMLLWAREAVDLTEGLSFDAFQRNRTLQLAVEKTLETVGEAAAQVNPEVRRTHAEIPWSRIIGMRNRLVHGYFDINLSRVWETVRQDVPNLVKQLERIVPADTD